MVEQKALRVGESVTSRSARLTREAAIGFAQEFDPQPMHIDQTAAQDGFFGKLVASGWHALAVTMRLAVEARPFGDAPLIGAELGPIRFTQPILPETDLCVRITFESIEEGQGQHGYNLLKVETLDAASGDTLICQRWRMLRA
ncbi:MaoC/PaaZ C-terminal domain-containing protein [Pseudophaeobacter sp. EL27]|uniref:MaoC/PaaZ C-terminal domain-containing protein n=1 Tax=Pseudophaeobacter sp. EL27 TaxID=2107580 RepID=UPI001C1F640F|nr:MaoC/PaaZ C-terminal domain-containing protein [Pseudophaeobacter sp. EL27]